MNKRKVSLFISCSKKWGEELNKLLRSLYLDRRFDTRYLAFKSQRTGHSRHASSMSSPPSLIPFVKSLSSPGPPPASTTPRKYSLQPQQQHGHSRNLSAETISYPIISRIDSVSTFTPDQEPRPAPLPLSTMGEKTPQQRQKSTDEDRTPTPQQRITSKTRSPPPPLNLALNGVSNYVNFPRRPSSSSGSTTTVKPRRGSDATKERSELPREKSGSRLKGLRISDVRLTLSVHRLTICTDSLNSLEQTSYTSSHIDSSEDETSPVLDRRRPSHTIQPPPGLGHRRSISEESPRIVQAMTFTRAKSAEDVLPSDSELPTARPAQSWNTASPALIPFSEVKAAKAKAKALSGGGGGGAISPTRVPPKPVTPTRISPTKVPEPPRPLSAGATNSISISVKDSMNVSKEFGRASLGRDGVTVCLKSYNKAEDMEVSWTCVPRVDEEGRPFTQWEMKFRPRLDPTSSSGLPGQAPPPPLPAPSLSTANTNFLNYRINGSSSSSSSASPFAQPPPLRQHSTTSPLSQAIDPLLASGSLPSVERRRKSSSTSTSRSDSFSNGTSFSSESSAGPPTPASYLASSSGASPNRRRKSSSISHTLATYDFDNKPPPLPTSATSSYFDIPVPPSSTKPSYDEQVSPSRTNRSSSYNPGAGTNQRSRQFSIDPSVYVPRSASVPDAGILVSAPVKSPRDNRFARCLPPANEAKVDLFALSTNSNAGSSSSSSPSSFLASRNNLNNGGGGGSSGRKGSICSPPPHLSIPCSTSTIAEETSPTSHTTVTSPFAPSPLGRSNVVYLSDQNRTPTRPTHFNLPPPPLPCKLTTTPSPPPPPPKYQPPSSSTESSFTTAEESSSLSSFGIALRGGSGGGTSEELSSLSPAFSIDAEDDDDEAAAEEAFGRRMARNRQGKRMMSRWSDTETEEDEELENSKGREGLTSWGKLPDSNTTDEEA